jgi:hypothetical protein
MLDNGWLVFDWQNRRFEFPLRRISIALCESGTRHLYAPSSRLAGTVLLDTSVSSQRAPNTSPDRAAVRMQNSSAVSAVAFRVRRWNLEGRATAERPPEAV